MDKRLNWFSKHTQQTVMSKMAIFPVISRTGPNSKGGPVKHISKNVSVFIVGESEVGGEHIVGGTP